jgi:hypothetical protein
MPFQRHGERLPQQPRAGVKQRHQVGDGKAATGLGLARLAEVGLQLRGVRHREAAAVAQESAVPEPEPLLVGVGVQGSPGVLQQTVEDGQRQPGAGLAESRGGEGPADQAGQVGQGGVAVQDLGEKQVDDGDGVQQAVPPGVADGTANVEDGRAVEPAGDVVPELLPDGT